MLQQLGRYRIENLLGEGSFAWVYRAIDPELERPVALKVLKPAWLSDPQALARFKQEAKTMARLHHPNIAVIYEVGEAEGQVFLAQFLVEGETLAAKLKREGALAWPEMLKILRPVASALDYAHAEGIIHRDIKPANILLDKKGQSYLSDFGLVRAAEGSVILSTGTGGLIGTPPYMAPELWEGKPATATTDVYALTCVVVEMLTGKVLFDGSSTAEVIKQHVVTGPIFPSEWPSGVPSGVSEVMQGGLTEHTTARIGSAGDLVERLVNLGVNPQKPIIQDNTQHKVEVKPQTKAPEVKAPPQLDVRRITRKAAPSIPIWVGLGLVLLAIIGGGVFLITSSARPIDRIAFSSNRDGNPEIYNLDDQGVDRLTNNSMIDTEPVWSPDGSTLAFASNRDGNWEIYILNTDGSVSRMTNNSADDREPTWSPDGSTLAFASNRDGNWEIYTLDPNKTITRMTNDAAEDREPAWSPDGSTLAFASNRDGNWEIYTLDSHRVITRMTNDAAEDREPAWSPNGSTLAFASNRHGNWEIYTLNPSREVKRLTDNPAVDRKPTWSPDGGYIAFQSNRDGNEEIYVMNTDGNRLTNKTNLVTAVDVAPAWSPMQKQ